MNCRSHVFPTATEENWEMPMAGDECANCGVIYCPVAYDHDAETGCMVCGWDGIEYEIWASFN